MKEHEVREDRGKGIGDCGHHLDKDIKCNSDNVLTSITNCVACYGGLVSRSSLSVPS